MFYLQKVIKYLENFYNINLLKLKVIFENENAHHLIIKTKNLFIYFKKIIEIVKIFFFILKNKFKENTFVVLLYNYKNDVILKDVEKTKMFFNKFIETKLSSLYNKNVLLLSFLYSKYLEKYFIIIKNKIKIMHEKYFELENRFNIYIENKEVLNKKNFILKQNKSISYSSIISVLGSRQRSSIYSANPSLWPVFLSLFAGIFVLLFVCVLHNQNFLFFLNKQVFTAILGGAICISFWMTTFYKEKQLGFHSYEVRRNIRLGFYIFIFTEAICFLSLFWTFLHALLAASLNIGLHNPGEGIVHFWMSEARLFHPYWERFYYLEDQKALLVNLTDHTLYRNKKVYDKNLVIKVHINLHDKGQLINPYKFPLMNTFILLASACSLNASHTQIKMGKYLTALIMLFFTIILGLAFVFIQYKEIKDCTIQFTDGIYGSCFYSLTGLHGTHVILGIFGLFICFLNFLKYNYSQKRHDTYWFAILYWHFVDIVWILVYLIIYIWPSFYFHRSGIRWAQLDHNSYCFNFSEEAFENTFHYKLYRDRTKLNHKLVMYSASSLDQSNLFKTGENVFNYEHWRKIDREKILLISNQDCKRIFYLNKNNELSFKLHFVNKITMEELLSLVCEQLGQRNIAEKSTREIYESKQKFKKFSILNNMENKSKIIDASNLLYDFINSFNYNGIKKRTAEHAIVFNIVHFIIFEEIHTQETYDLLNKKYKIFFFFFFSCFSKKLSFFWCKYFTPYYF